MYRQVCAYKSARTTHISASALICMNLSLFQASEQADTARAPAFTRLTGQESPTFAASNQVHQIRFAPDDSDAAPAHPPHPSAKLLSLIA